MTQGVTTLVVVLAGILLAVLQQQGWPKELSALGFIATPGWLVWLYSRAELQWDALYQFRVGLWARLNNPTVNWSSQFVLYDVSNQAAFEELQAWLYEHYRRQDTNVLASSEDSLSLSVRGIGTIIVERTSRRALAADLAPTKPRPGDTLVIELPNMSSGYRDALRTADNEVLPLLQVAIASARPADGTYNLVARFPNGNPYFGLYVRRLVPLGRQNIRFTFAFDETIKGSRRNVVVSQNNVEVAAHDLQGFQSLVQRYLAVI